MDDRDDLGTSPQQATFVLPGKYAFVRKYEEYAIVVTFQSYQELREFIDEDEQQDGED